MIDYDLFLKTIPINNENLKSIISFYWSWCQILFLCIFDHVKNERFSAVKL